MVRVARATADIVGNSRVEATDTQSGLGRVEKR
jgi:hypothetical protein